MNHVYQLVWNAAHHAWVAVSEVASGLGGRSTRTRTRHPALPGLAAWLLALAGPVAAQAIAPTALPQGGVVTQGAATLQGAGSASAPVLNVNQSSPRAVIDWNSFNLGSASAVNFNQPNAQSATLNRVLDMNPSQILGRIHAPGQVTLINPAGVYFSPGAVLDVGALTATTLNQTDADFMAGKALFQRNGATGSVVNAGTINARDYIALLAPEVRNAGRLTVATAGTVALAGGEAVRLNFDPFSRLASITVTPSQIATLVENRAAVLAPGGQIILSATALRGLQASVVNSGQLDASSLTAKGGRIVLEGDHIALGAGSSQHASGATGGGTVLVGGDWQGSGSMVQATTVAMAQSASIDASATQSGDGGKVVLWSDVHRADGSTIVNGSITARGMAAGGRVETSGHTVALDTAQIDAGGLGSAGLWLIDPYDYTIGTTQAATIGSTLSSGTSVTVDTSADVSGQGSSGVNTGAGNIAVNANITKTGGVDTTLTLKAHNHITMAANVAISSTSNKLNVVFNSDLDGVNGGSIQFGTGATIATSGGNITLGGGTAGDGSGFAVGGTGLLRPVGIHMEGTNVLDAAGGNIALRGKGRDNALHAMGVFAAEGTQWLTTGSGSVSVEGEGGQFLTASVPTDNEGVLLYRATVTTASGAVTVIGRGGQSTGNANRGVHSSGGTITTTGGNILIEGTGGGVGPSSISNDGIAIDSTVTAGGAGTVTLRGRSSHTGVTEIGVGLYGGMVRTDTGDITLDSGTNLSDWTNNPSVRSTGNGNISITADAMFLSGSATVNAGTGTVTIQNSTAGLLLAPEGESIFNAGAFNTLGIPARLFNGTTAGTLVVGRNDGHASGKITGGVNAPNVTHLVYETGDGIALNRPTIIQGSVTFLPGDGRSVTQNAAGRVVTTSLLLGGNGANYALATATTNNIGTLAAPNVGTLAYQDADAFSVGTVGAATGIGAIGTVNLSTRTGDLTLAASVATANASTSAIVLNAGLATAARTATGGNLIFSGSPTLTMGSAGRATLFSGSVSGSTGLTDLVGSGSGHFRYDSDEAQTRYTTALGTGLYAIYREQPTLTATGNTTSMVYGDPTPATSTLASFSGAVNGDDSSLAVRIGGSVSRSGNYTVGNHVVSPSASAAALGYLSSGTDGTLTVTPRALTASGITAANKIYNGTTAATLNTSAVVYSGLVSGDVVSLGSSTGSFADKNVGTAKTVTLVAALSGADAGNYSLGSASSAVTADITPKALTASGITASNKVYDGTTAATLNTSAAVYSGLVSGDVVSLGGITGNFADKNAGTAKAVTLVAALSGADAGNYSLGSGSSAVTADITPAALTVSTSNVVKTFDGTTSAAGSAVRVAGTLFGSDSLSGGSFAFTDPSVGVGNKTVTAAGVTVNDGHAGGNYAVAYADNTTSTINAASVTPPVVTPPVVVPPVVTPPVVVPPVVTPPVVVPPVVTPPVVAPPAAQATSALLAVEVLLAPTVGAAHAPATPTAPTAPVNPTLNTLQISAGAVAVAPASASASANTAAGAGDGASATGCSGTSQAGLGCDDAQAQAQASLVLVTPVRRVSPVMPGLVLVQVSPQLLRSGGFEAALPAPAGSALRNQATPAVAQLSDAQPLPAWLRFDPQTLVLTARAIPAGALPRTVVLRAGAEQVEVELTALP